jgi:hypothetical protein
MTVVISDSSVGARGGLTPRERPAGREIARGREAEQKMVGDLLRRAQQGTGGVLLVDGDPGIGKSLLLREATDTAAGLGFSLAAGAADELGLQVPFFALRAALGSPGSPPNIPVGTCPMTRRGGSSRSARIWSSGPRRARSWCAWMTCTGPARPRWRCCGPCRGS